MASVEERAERLIRLHGEKFYDSNLLRKDLQKFPFSVGSFPHKVSDCKYILTNELAKQIVARDNLRFYQDVLYRKTYIPSGNYKTSKEQFAKETELIEDTITLAEKVLDKRKDTPIFNKNLNKFCDILIDNIFYDKVMVDFSGWCCNEVKPLTKQEIAFINEFNIENKALLKMKNKNIEKEFI